MKLFRYSHTLAAIMISLALCAVGGLGFLIWSLAADRTALIELQFEYDDAVQKSTYAASVRTLLRDIEDEQAQLTAVTKGYDPVEVIRTIEDAARISRANITVNAVTPGTPASEDPSLASFLVNIDMSGTFDNLYHFVALVETLPLPVEIEQTRLEKLENRWSGGIVVRVYTDSEQSN